MQFNFSAQGEGLEASVKSGPWKAFELCPVIVPHVLENVRCLPMKAQLIVLAVSLAALRWSRYHFARVSIGDEHSPAFDLKSFRSASGRPPQFIFENIVKQWTRMVRARGYRRSRVRWLGTELVRVEAVSVGQSEIQKWNRIPARLTGSSIVQLMFGWLEWHSTYAEKLSSKNQITIPVYIQMCSFLDQWPAYTQRSNRETSHLLTSTDVRHQWKKTKVHFGEHTDEGTLVLHNLNA